MAPNTKRKAAQAGIVNNRIEPSRTKRRPPPMDPALLEQMYNSTNGAPSEYAVELTYLKSHPDDGQLVLDDAAKYGMLQNLIDNQLTQNSRDDPSADALGKYLLLNITRAQKQVEEKRKAIDEQNKVVEAAARRAQDAKNAAAPPPKPPPKDLSGLKNAIDKLKEGVAPPPAPKDLSGLTSSIDKLKTGATKPYNPPVDPDMKWWATLPGHSVDWKIGGALLGSGIGLTVINNMLFLQSRALGIASVVGIVSGGYLLTAKGLYWYANDGITQKGLNDIRTSIIPGLKSYADPKKGDCPNIIDTYFDTPIGKVPFPSLFAPFRAVQKGVCAGGKLAGKNVWTQN
jgi:hypothetical protein